MKLTDRVVQEERRGGPETDQRRRTRVTTTTSRHVVLLRLARHRIVPGDRADRRQIFVRLRREVVPDIAAERVRRKRTARVRLQECYGHARLSRKIIVFQKIV